MDLPDQTSRQNPRQPLPSSSHTAGPSAARAEYPSRTGVVGLALFLTSPGVTLPEWGRADNTRRLGVFARGQRRSAQMRESPAGDRSLYLPGNALSNRIFAWA